MIASLVLFASAFGVLREKITITGDLVQALARGRGYAFVGESFLGAPVVVGARREEVPLTNIARNRWDLDVRWKEGAAAPRSLPYDSLFLAPIVTSIPARAIPPKRFATPDGVRARADEVFAALGGEAKSLPWVLAQRMVTARFEASAIAGPEIRRAFATAIGGKIGKDGGIELDVAAIRRQGIATLNYRAAESDEVDRANPYAFGAVGFRVATDEQLKALYRTRTSAVFVELDAAESVNPVVSEYFQHNLRTYDLSIGAGPSLRGTLDFTSPLSVSLTARGSIGISMLSRDGGPRVIF